EEGRVDGQTPEAAPADALGEELGVQVTAGLQELIHPDLAVAGSEDSVGEAGTEVRGAGEVRQSQVWSAGQAGPRPRQLEGPEEHEVEDDGERHRAEGIRLHAAAHERPGQPVQAPALQRTEYPPDGPAANSHPP